MTSTSGSRGKSNCCGKAGLQLQDHSTISRDSKWNVNAFKWNECVKKQNSKQHGSVHSSVQPPIRIVKSS